jgi:hypothetical protein
MIEFSQPLTHHRFDSTVYEVLKMKFNGSVKIPGEWDPFRTLDYLERRTGIPLIPTLVDDGSSFILMGKSVSFSPSHVLISAKHDEIISSSC